MAGLRQVRHPGPADADRIDSGEGSGRSLDISLAGGVCLRDAVAAPLDAAGLTGAGVTFTGVRFQPFRYVVPAYAPDPAHVAYYSATHAPEEEIEVTHANLTFGRNADGPFLHCHALWRDRAGRVRGGHVLPFEAWVSQPGRASAFGTPEVSMLSAFDPETNFNLFRPVGGERLPVAGPCCILARIKPNQDLVEGVEEVCRRHGVRAAVVRSGVGSINGAEFGDGQVVGEHPTEILVLTGRVAPDDDGQPRAALTIALIDTKGDVHQGTPVRGRNPVLICFELVLEVLGP